jgi:hypothetical protein
MWTAETQGLNVKAGLWAYVRIFATRLRLIGKPLTIS